ncbi:hypothetical protein [Polyangium spumosum]|uniref:Uncharacterized protein n=1 Tax=Polyangium spumosum TaxID=889282 RepID=A0A6N7Q062_9BACT|nr:hypothetical protein [Polyangium spumosum]MRG96120.1 hypothetical protein [Polyangium spumosum]
MLYELTPSADSQLLSGVHSRRRRGLYVFLFENQTELDVYDNPRTDKRRKVVVPGGGASLKPGKFEQGFRVRLDSYNKHMHRRPNASSLEFAFFDTFRGGFLLDLSESFDDVPNPPKVFEPYWIECINAFAGRRSLFVEDQKHRPEWRHLRVASWTPEVRALFGLYIAQVADQIRAMATFASIPNPSSNVALLK